jgi:hypothetical protein
MTSFTNHPDQDWTEDNKKRWRKCKHMIVALEDFQPETSMSQTGYKEQLQTFVGHLLKVIPDDTFPIRLLTWTTTMTTTMTSPPPFNNRWCCCCHEDRFLPRTTDHPCNDVIKHLFNTKNRNGSSAAAAAAPALFPERVKLLDTTDLALPWAPSPFSSLEQQQKEGQKYQELVLANIALRIFVVAGKQVADWRAVGQHGEIDGLHRNGEIEPNFELVPYTGW